MEKLLTLSFSAVLHVLYIFGILVCSKQGLLQVVQRKGGGVNLTYIKTNLHKVVEHSHYVSWQPSVDGLQSNLISFQGPHYDVNYVSLHFHKLNSVKRS